MLPAEIIHAIAEVEAYKWRHNSYASLVSAIEAGIRAYIALDEKQREVVAFRAYDAMKAEPALERSCAYCKHRPLSGTQAPCNTCLSGRDFPNWIAKDGPATDVAAQADAGMEAMGFQHLGEDSVPDVVQATALHEYDAMTPEPINPYSLLTPEQKADLKARFAKAEEKILSEDKPVESASTMKERK